MNTQQTTGRQVSQVAAFAFALIVTLATLAGIDHLAATQTSGQMLAGAPVAQAQA